MAPSSVSSVYYDKICIKFASHHLLLYVGYTGMWVSRPGLGLETDQDHFFEVLVLVLVSEGGLEQDLRLCATATLLVSKVETSK